MPVMSVGAFDILSIRTALVSPFFCTVGRFIPGGGSKYDKRKAKVARDIRNTCGMGAGKLATVGESTLIPTAKVRVKADTEPTLA